MKRLVFHSIIVLFVGFACGSGTQVQAQNYLQDPMVFPPNMGYPHESIRVFVQDKNQITWIGTRRGLSRFDGHTFETFLHDPKDPNSISNHEINAVCPNPSTGKIWIGHEGGLSVFSPEKKTFKNYYFDKEAKQGIPSNKISSIFINKEGEIWIGVHHYGLFQYHAFSDNFIKLIAKGGNGTSPRTINFRPEKILQDDLDKNKLWIASSKGLAYLDKKTKMVSFIEHRLKNKNNISFSKRIRSLCQLPNGKLYLGLSDEGLVIFDKKNQTFTQVEDCGEAKVSELPNNFAHLSPYSDHEFWISSKLGAYLYDANSDCISFAKKSTRRTDEKYRVDYIDSQNRIWARGYKGFHVFNPELQQDFEFKTFDFGPFSNRGYPRKIILDTLNKKQYLLFRESQGLYAADLYADNWKLIPPPEAYAKAQKRGFPCQDMVLLKDGSLFIITRREAFTYQQGFKTLKEYPLDIKNKKSPSFAMLNIIQDQEGTFWISGLNKLYNLKLGNHHLENISKKYTSRDHKWIKGSKLIKDKNGNIYLPGRKGLQIYLKKEDRFVVHPFRDDFDFNKSYPICMDDSGDIWFVLGEKYLIQVDSQDPEKGTMMYFDKKEGLECQEVYAIIPYHKQLVLLSKTGTQIFDIKEKVVTKNFNFHKTSSDPIGSAVLAPDNRIMALSKEGLLSFKFEELKNSETTLRPYLSGFKVLGSEKIFPVTYDLPLAQSLNHDENFFSFKFSAIGYDFPEKTSFYYQLKGVDKRWLAGTPGEYIRYTDVPSGDYEFWVEAYNSSEESIGPKLIAKLNISTPWWKTIWFKALLLGILFTIGFIFYKTRIARIRKEEQQKAKVDKLLAEAEMAALRAQMNPHFIFNSLNSIDYYIIKQDQETASDYLNRFSRLIRLVLQNSKSDKVPLKNDLEAVQLYIELESLRFSKKFEYDISIDPNIDLENTIIPPMLIQPYVENAIWHGLMQQKDKTGFLHLSLHLEKDFLICQVKDNGIGRAAAMALKSKSGSQRKSFGMKITKDRLQMLNTMAKAKAEVLITDLKNIDGSPAGTRVDLKIPIEKLNT